MLNCIQNPIKPTAAAVIPPTQKTESVQNSKPETTNNIKAENLNSGKDLVNNTNFIKQLDEIFKKLDGKDGKEFADCAYSELVKYMGLDGIAPKSITWMKNEGRPIIGDYMFYNNSVVFYTDYFLTQDKASQLATIAHELTHCKQLANMLTTEGLSVEKIASAYAVSDLRAMLTRNPKVIEMHKTAKANGKEKEFMQMMVRAGTIKTAKELYQAHAQTLKLPKHSLNSPEGIKAQKDWVAQFNYNGADIKAYNACPLEKEAMFAEKMIKAAYNTRNK